jgi:hypothetical protein
VLAEAEGAREALERADEDSEMKPTSTAAASSTPTAKGGLQVTACASRSSSALERRSLWVTREETLFAT